MTGRRGRMWKRFFTGSEMRKSFVPTKRSLRDVIGRAPKLRYIGVLATGYNVVDVDAASEKGIVVTNIPAYGTAAVAQHTMALLLEICNQVGYHSQAVHEGRWQRSEDFCFWDHPLMELAGKTMGIIGYGAYRTGHGKAGRGLRDGCDRLPPTGQHPEYGADRCRQGGSGSEPGRYVTCWRC